MRSAVIVAGGYSTRFGAGDKALAELNGTPMLRHVADRLAPVIDTLVVNGRLDQLDGFAAAMEGYVHQVDYAPDEDDGRGPVGGIATGLAACPPATDRAFVVACDMPFVDAAVVDALFERAATSTAPAIVPRTDDGWYQVLHAVYDPNLMLDACRRALVDGDRKVLAPLSHLAVEQVESTDIRGLEASTANVNTTEALRSAERRLADEPSDSR